MELTSTILTPKIKGERIIFCIKVKHFKAQYFLLELHLLWRPLDKRQLFYQSSIAAARIRWESTQGFYSRWETTEVWLLHYLYCLLTVYSYCPRISLAKWRIPCHWGESCLCWLIIATMVSRPIEGINNHACPAPGHSGYEGHYFSALDCSKECMDNLYALPGWDNLRWHDAAQWSLNRLRTSQISMVIAQFAYPHQARKICKLFTKGSTPMKLAMELKDTFVLIVRSKVK